MKWIITHLLSLCLAANSMPLESSGAPDATQPVDEADKVVREIENTIPVLSDDDEVHGAGEIASEKSVDQLYPKLPGAATATSTQPSVTTSTSSSQNLNPLFSLFQPIAQRIQFSPQKFFTDRLKQLTEALASFGITVPNNFGLDQKMARQLAGQSGLIHVAGLNDDGFYTDRLEPAGFFSGNGWFANKGGLLGGPGAIFSTGSILTDYPTAYKK